MGKRPGRRNFGKRKGSYMHGQLFTSDKNPRKVQKTNEKSKTASNLLDSVVIGDTEERLQVEINVAARMLADSFVIGVEKIILEECNDQLVNVKHSVWLSDVDLTSYIYLIYKC